MSMASLQRTALRSTRAVRPQIRQQCRRKASTNPPDHTPPKDQHNAHPPPKNESFGRGFFVAIAAIPATIAIVSYSREGSTPFFTRWIRDTYSEYSTSWARRNDLHTQMVEQAGADRTLFLNDTKRRLPDIRFPEQFNFGSPWNVGGSSYANVDAAIEKFRKEASEAQEQKLQELRDNKIPAEQPVQRLVKRAPGPSN